MNRNISQNALFDGEYPDDPDDHPVGRRLIQDLNTLLMEEGWELTPCDNWRDCGWVFFAALNRANIQIVVSMIETNTWMLQIANTNDPGWFARLFGSTAIDHSDTIFRIANSIHEILVEYNFTNFRWCHDGYPDDTNSEPTPFYPDRNAG